LNPGSGGQLLTPNLNSSGEMLLIPFYEQMRQTSLDLQATKGHWLWKLEVINRSSDSYNGSAGLVGIAESEMDIEFLSEFLYDSRGDDASAPFENDIFIRIHLTATDVDGSELLTGVIKDLDDAGLMFNLEASRRLGNHWKTATEIRFWSDIPEDGLLFSFHRDDYIEISVTRFF
jgi:hypothetical protein